MCVPRSGVRVIKNCRSLTPFKYCKVKGTKAYKIGMTYLTTGKRYAVMDEARCVAVTPLPE